MTFDHFTTVLIQPKRCDYADQLGVFYVDPKAVRTEAFAEVLALLKFTPLHVEPNFEAGRGYKFAGYSPLFRELEQSELTPEYDIHVTENRSHQISEVFPVEVINET